MKEIHGVDIPRKSPKRTSLLGTPKTARSWRYLAWIRTLPCSVCGAVIPRKPLTREAMVACALKASGLLSAVPLCADHHTAAADSYHALGKAGFEIRHNVYFAKLVKRLNSLWFDPGNRVA